MVTDAHSRRNAAKSNAHFNIFDISNHSDKIVPKNMDFRNEFQFEGTVDDLKALRGNILEMDSLHLAKTRNLTPVDKELLDNDDCDSECDDFEEDMEFVDTYEVPLKRSSSKQGRNNIHTIAEEDKATTKNDFGQRIKDSLVDSLHLNRERLEESK
ncbi:MAG: hypothetical protein SGBAC_006051 [Bacillariaceae sp.]